MTGGASYFQNLASSGSAQAAGAASSAESRGRRGRRRVGRGPLTGVLAFAVFLFPALWKLQTLGLDWTAPETVLRHMQWKATQFGHPVPEVPPTLLRTGAVATILAELGAPILVLFRRLAKSSEHGRPVRGRLWNMFEAFLLFIRDGIAKPATSIGIEIDIEPDVA